jgi:hypothetical protein
LPILRKLKWKKEGARTSMTTLFPGAGHGSDWKFERRSEPNGTLPHQW